MPTVYGSMSTDATDVSAMLCDTTRYFALLNARNRLGTQIGGKIAGSRVADLWRETTEVQRHYAATEHQLVATNLGQYASPAACTDRFRVLE